MERTNYIGKEIIGQFFLKNGEAYSTEIFNPEETSLYPSLYEVIRVTAQVPLFFEEHFQRLIHSAKLLNYPLSFSQEQVREQVHQLMESNQADNLNVKIVVNNLDATEPNLFLFFIPSHYPTEKQYEEGVPTILYRAERENPNAKVVAHHLRQAVNEEIKKAGAYEAILVNNRNEITEGSRSNIFLIQNNALYTAPAHEVLVGITRSRIIGLCKELGIEVMEQAIPLVALDEIEGLFLTGTSPKALPIASIDEKNYHSASHPIVLAIGKAYDAFIEEYIRSYRR